MEDNVKNLTDDSKMNNFQIIEIPKQRKKKKGSKAVGEIIV